jgi:hypothetical protein
VVGIIGSECAERRSAKSRAHAQSWAEQYRADLAGAYCGGLVRKLLVFIEEYEVSIRSKLAGGCDAVLLVLVGALQAGLLVTFAGTGAERGEPVGIDTEQVHVEVVVVEATKIARG